VLYAFKLGPFDSSEGKTNAFVGISEVGMVPPVWTNDAKAGLEGLKQHVWGEELVCEPGLSRVGKPLGFRGMKPPEWVLEPRAQLAATLVFAGQLDNDDLDAYIELVQATAVFADAKPFTWWHDEQPLDVTVWGALDQRFEGCMMGHAGITVGLALYDRPGAVERIAQLVDDGEMARAQEEDFLVVTLDGGPAFAARALRDAYGVEAVPLPIRQRAGKRVFAARKDMLALSAALRAVAELAPGHTSAEIDGEAHEGEHVGARVVAPDPEG
jgi:hypothetical protein